MSVFNIVIAAVTPTESEESRKQARAKGRGAEVSGVGRFSGGGMVSLRVTVDPAIR